MQPAYTICLAQLGIWRVGCAELFQAGVNVGLNQKAVLLGQGTDSCWAWTASYALDPGYGTTNVQVCAGGGQRGGTEVHCKCLAFALEL